MPSDIDPNPGVPAILEVPAFASVHISVVGPAGRELATATAFAVRDTEHKSFLITNRHIVTGRDWETDQIMGTGVAPSALVASLQRGGTTDWKQVVIPLCDAESRHRRG